MNETEGRKIRKEILEGDGVWKNDDRMRLLFARLPPKNIDPETTKRRKDRTDSWTYLLTTCGTATFDPFIQPQHLKNEYQKTFADGDCLVPLCLDDVLLDLVGEGKLEEREGHRKKATQKVVYPGKGWSVGGMMSTSASWSWNATKSAVSYVWGGSSSELAEKYVLLPVVQKVAEEFRKKTTTDDFFDYNKATIIDEQTATLPFSAFLSIIQTIFPHHSPDLHTLLLEHLMLTNSIAVFSLSPTPITEWDPSKLGVKMTKTGLSSSSSSKCPAVSEIDTGSLHLLSTAQLLRAQIQQLEETRDETSKEIRVALSKGEREKAKRLLGKVKRLRGVLDQRLESLLNLERTLEAMRSASTNKAIVQAFQEGKETLKAFSERNDLTVGKVENVMDELEDVLADSEEVSSAIGSVSLGVEMGEEEMEAELEELVQFEETRKREEEEKQKQKEEEGKGKGKEQEEDSLEKRLAALSIQPQSEVPKEKEKEAEAV